MNRRWLNPLRIRVSEGITGWAASYARGRTTWRVSGCESRAEALAELRLFVLGEEAS